MGSFIIYLLAVGTWLSLIAAVISFVKFREEKAKVTEYLSHTVPYQTAPKKMNFPKQMISLFDQFSQHGKKIPILNDPAQLEDYLTKSGYPYNLNVDRILGARVVVAIGSMVLSLLYFLLGLPLAPFVLVFGPLAGYMLPIWLIKYLAKRRQEQIRYDLPDFLDMMSITLQAGMGLDSALSYYVETAEGPLSEEIGRMNQEVQFGVQREAAYRGLLKRTDSPELEALIQSMIQAHNLGTPIAQTFAQQSEEMRQMRAEQAKEAAGKAEPKISVVAGLIIAPSIMLLLLGSLAFKFFFSDSGTFQQLF